MLRNVGNVEMLDALSQRVVVLIVGREFNKQKMASGIPRKQKRDVSSLGCAQIMKNISHLTLHLVFKKCQSTLSSSVVVFTLLPIFVKQNATQVFGVRCTVGCTNRATVIQQDGTTFRIRERYSSGGWTLNRTVRIMFVVETIAVNRVAQLVDTEALSKLTDCGGMSKCAYGLTGSMIIPPL